MSLPPANAGWALFLDVDGTLLEIAETPESVRVPDDLKRLLLDLWLRLDGAVALVSGRSIASLDSLFAPLRLCASGVHGCELRDVRGAISRPSLVPDALQTVRAQLEAFVAANPGLLLEDKGFGLAMHFRLAPQLSDDVFAVMQRACQRLGPHYTLQAGKCVLELRPTGFSKGTSIAELMRQQPFKGRTPLFLGDDITDEDGFAVVNQLGGVSIKVGDAPTTSAQQRLSGVSEVHRWLRSFLQEVFAATRT
jgi:trehalose 6-phosphate phosphatase